MANLTAAVGNQGRNLSLTTMMSKSEELNSKIPNWNEPAR